MATVSCGGANVRRTTAPRSDHDDSVDPGDPFIVTIVLPFAWLFQLSRLPLDGWCHRNAALGSASSWMEVLVWCSQFLPVTIDTIATARPADAQQTLGSCTTV